MKRFFLIVFAFLGLAAGARAQDTLITAPDTVCVRQPIQLSTPASALEYYWSFCPGNLRSNPAFRNLGSRFGLNQPVAIELARDRGRFFAFVLNSNRALVRLDFGNTLNNFPLITPMGSYDTTVPSGGGGLFLYRDNGNWHLFATGGNNAADASLARFDFGPYLGTMPNSVNMGNPGGILRKPQGLFVAKEGTDYYGYIVDRGPVVGQAALIRVIFGDNVSRTPTMQNLGNIGFMSEPTDIVMAKFNGGLIRAFVSNTGTSNLTALDFAYSLNNTPVGRNAGDFFGTMEGPTGLSYYRDCERPYLLVTNQGSNNLVRLDLDNFGNLPTQLTGVYTYLSNATIFNNPTGISPLVRDGDDLFLLGTNAATNSLAEVRFRGCNRVSAPSSSDSLPPTYSYDTAGTYYVYLTLNDGSPDMRTFCKKIVVLPLPGLTLSNDTLICQGDTINLSAISLTADSVRWSPAYNLSSTTTQRVLAWPDYSIRYRVFLNYVTGCTIDTGITVRVVGNRADAGSDRTILDGSSTILGGPNTPSGPGYRYLWTPANYLDDPNKPNPVATPLGNFTYYLNVIHTTPELTCTSIDSVVVRTLCNGVNLPNAFAPESRIDGANRFGLLNRQIVRLISFTIFNRWGQKVFSTTDPTKEWEGTFNGEVAPAGVYVWEVDAYCPSGQRIRETGNVTLLR